MDFSLSEEQEILKKAARDFLSDECPLSLVREMAEDEKGYSPGLWRKIADLGWLGLPFPGKYGGSGGSFLDLTVLLEEMGRARLPGPFFSTVVLGGLAILEGGSESQKKELLPGIVRGDLVLTLALAEPGVGYNPEHIRVTAEAEKGDYVISGTKLFVSDAHIADCIVCAARTEEDGISLFLVDVKSPGLGSTLLKTTGRDKQCEVTFDKVRVPGKNLLGDRHRGLTVLDKVLQWAAIGKCAEMIGGAQRVLEMTVSHSRERVQFGRPIGSLQVFQHAFADWLYYIEASRLATCKAAWMLSEGLPCAKAVSIAKAFTSDAYQQITPWAHVILGGVGFCEEHDMPHYFRQAKAAEVAFGDADFHREIIAEQLGL